jgi:DNA-binding NarL/FixJ family response regulator
MVRICTVTLSLGVYEKAKNYASSCEELECEAQYCEPWKAAIDQLGFSLRGFAGYFVVLELLVALPFSGLSLLVIYRRSDNVMEVASDVILMDINMPDLNGIESTRAILQIRPTTRIIMASMLEDDASVFAATRAGARAYVLKGANHVEMQQSIRAVASGQALFGSAIAVRITDFFQHPGTSAGASYPDEVLPELTERERELLGLISRGYNNAEIAEELVISPKTVRNHITSIFTKLQVADRAQAVVRVRKAGLK